MFSLYVGMIFWMNGIFFYRQRLDVMWRSMIDNHIRIEIIFKALDYLYSPRDDKTCRFDLIAKS